MKIPLSLHGLWLLPLIVLGPIGCGKPDEPTPEVKAEATPSPTPGSDAVADASDKIRDKADKTINSLTTFLHKEDPRFQAKLQKLADKVTRDKDKWRKKLQQKREELQPQIEQLKEQVAKAEGKTKADVDQQLATLEAQSHNAEKKLTELEGASGDALRKLKADFKEAEAKGDVTRDDANTPPSPSPSPSP